MKAPAFKLPSLPAFRLGERQKLDSAGDQLVRQVEFRANPA